MKTVFHTPKNKKPVNTVKDKPSETVLFGEREGGLKEEMARNSQFTYHGISFYPQHGDNDVSLERRDRGKG